MPEAATHYDLASEHGPVDNDQFFFQYKRNQDAHHQRRVGSAQYNSIDEATETSQPGIGRRVMRHPLSGLAASVLAAIGIGYAMCGEAQATMADVPTTQTSLVSDLNGLKITSQTYLDNTNGWRVFDYLVENNTGDTIFEAKFFGQDWVGGGGVNQSWLTEILASTPADPVNDYLKFYDGLLHDGSSEEWVTASAWKDTWAQGPAILRTTQGNTFQGDVWKPSNPAAVPEPATLTLVGLGALYAGRLAKKRNKE